MPLAAQPHTCSNAGPTMRIRCPSFLRHRYASTARQYPSGSSFTLLCSLCSVRVHVHVRKVRLKPDTTDDYDAKTEYVVSAFRRTEPRTGEPRTEREHEPRTENPAP